MEMKQILTTLGVANSIENCPTGTVAIANAASSHGAVETFLTEMAVARSIKSNLAEARRMLAPDAPVIGGEGQTAYTYRYFPAGEDFRTVKYDAMKRAGGGDFPEVADRSELRSGILHQIGLSISLEKSQIQRIPGLRERATKKLVDIIERATLIKTLEIWESFADDTTISLATEKNPDGKLRELLRLAGDKSGVRPNAMLYGPAAWDLRTTKYETAELSTGALRAAETTDALGNRLNVRILVPDGRQAGVAGSFPVIGANKIYAGYSLDGLSTEDPSTMKTMRDGAGIQIYESTHSQGQKVIITASVWQDLRITSAAGAIAVTVSE